MIKQPEADIPYVVIEPPQNLKKDPEEADPGSKLKDMEKQLETKNKQLNDERQRTKIYKIKVENLQAELAQLRCKQPDSEVPKDILQKDYVRLVKKCLATIEEYELQIIELKKEKNKNTEVQKYRKLDMYTKDLSTVKHQHAHLAKGDHDLQNECERLQKQIQQMQKLNRQKENSYKKQIEEIEKRNEVLKNNHKMKLQNIENTLMKETEKLQMQIENYKIKETENQEIIKQMTEARQVQHKVPAGKTKNLQNINKKIDQCFAVAEKELNTYSGKTMPPTIARSIIRKFQISLKEFIDL